MTKIRVEQIAIVEGTAFVSGRPVNDQTKVMIGAADVIGAMAMALAMQDGEVEVDMPAEAVVQILELPPKREG